MAHNDNRKAILVQRGNASAFVDDSINMSVKLFHRLLLDAILEYRDMHLRCAHVSSNLPFSSQTGSPRFYCNLLASLLRGRIA